MQGQKPYAQFLKIPADKQGPLIQDQVQGQPKQLIADLTQAYPEVNFFDMRGTQDKKPIKLANYRYAPSGNVKGVVVVFHSMNLHTGVFVQLGKTLAANGYVLTGFDMRGHGKSEGQRGYIDDSKQVWKDIENFLKQITKIYPQKPLFLLGHGLGSLLVINIVKDSKIKVSGIILISAALKRPTHNKVMSAISGFALKMMPNKAGLFEPNYSNMFKNPNASKFIVEDKNVYHEKVVAGTLTQMMSFMKKNEEEDWPKLVTPPLLIIQGQYDKIADPTNSIKFFESIKTKDKKYQWFPKMWNGFFLEEQYPQVEQRILKWLSARC